MKRLVGTNKWSLEGLGEYVDNRKYFEGGNIEEWALNVVEEDAEEETAYPVKSTKKEKFVEDLSALVVSHDRDIINRIGDWLKYNGRGIDVARLYVGLGEADEIRANLTDMRFIDSLKTSFPEV